MLIGNISYLRDPAIFVPIAGCLIPASQSQFDASAARKFQLPA
jgi:hypothetical protein